MASSGRRAHARAAGIVALVASVGVAVGPWRARAQPAGEEVEPIHLEFHVGAGCPSEQEFIARLHAHTPRFRIAGKDEPARTLVIEVSVTPKGADGRMSFRETAGPSGVRALRGETCGEVVAGLALMAALAIDPAATISPSASASTTASAPSSVSSGSGASSASASAAPASASVSVVAPEIAPPTSTVRVSIGAAGETVFGLSPTPLFGGNVSLEVLVDRARIVSPAFRLALHADVGPHVSADAGGVARFSRFVATLDACPLVVPARSTFSLRPCAQLGGGFVQGSGSDIVDARTTRERWLFAALLGRASWAPLPALRIELALGAALPFQRYRFRFEPATSLYETPSIAAFGELGALLSF